MDEHGNFKMPRIVEMEDLLEVERREKERIRLAGRDQADTVTWEVRDEKVERALNKLFLIRVLRLSFFFLGVPKKKIVMIDNVITGMSVSSYTENATTCQAKKMRILSRSLNRTRYLAVLLAMPENISIFICIVITCRRAHRR